MKKNFPTKFSLIMLIAFFNIALIISLSDFYNTKNSTNYIIMSSLCYSSFIIINFILEPLYLIFSSKLSNLSINYIVFKFFILYKSNNLWHFTFKKDNHLNYVCKYNYKITLCNNKKQLIKFRRSTNFNFLCFITLSSILPIIYIIIILYFTPMLSLIFPAILIEIINIKLIFSPQKHNLSFCPSYLYLLEKTNESTLYNMKHNSFVSNELLKLCKPFYTCNTEKKVNDQFIIMKNILELVLFNLIDSIPKCFYDNLNYLLAKRDCYISNDFIESSHNFYYLLSIYLHKFKNKTLLSIEMFNDINANYKSITPEDKILKNKTAYILGFKHNLEALLNNYVFSYVDNKAKERVYIEGLRVSLTNNIKNRQSPANVLSS